MEKPETLPVWDIAVRLFHWFLVTLVIWQWWSGGVDSLLDGHETGGFIILGLVVARVIWGFVGGQHARFRNFIASPFAALRFLQQELNGTVPRYIGHNPAGGLMILALLVMLSATAISGWLAYENEHEHSHGTDITHELSLRESPLSESPEEKHEPAGPLSELHENLANITLALAILHVLGVIFSSVMQRENLIRPMFTGRKSSDHDLND